MLSRMGGAQPAEELTESYVRWRTSRLGRITDALERQLVAGLLGRVDGKKLLDVGCGDGAMAFELARQGATVTALDADPTMIAAARLRAGNEATRVQLVEGDAESLPFDDATFDVVVAVTVLGFVQDAEHAVKEIARVLKPEGRVVIGDLGRWSLWAAQRRMRGSGASALARSEVPDGGRPPEARRGGGAAGRCDTRSRALSTVRRGGTAPCPR
jgi:2-polyprenyl-3-methyl-5-hydroxy-6-metoxy-1,4-benzoquinol methylase